MAKKEPETEVVRSSTTHKIPVEDGAIEATVTVEHNQKDKVIVAFEPMPFDLADWVAVANFVLETAEAIEEAQSGDDDGDGDE
jgi:hypothetical protein